MAITNPIQPNPAIPEASWGSVPCRYGIISISLPIAGMRFGDIKPTLKSLFKLAEGTVAIVNGRELSDDDIIGDGVECLNFIKPFRA